MTCIRIPNGFICVNNSPDRKIRDQVGVQFTFEDHPQFGPFVLDKRGDPKSKQPGERASFWKVYQWWAEQGKTVGDDGFCVWKEPAPTYRIEHIVGRHYIIVPL